MFEQLQGRLSEILTRLRGRGRLGVEDVDEALREVRLALLEADVNFKVAREFVGRVREAAVGQEVWKSLTPGQQVVQIVFGELTPRISPVKPASRNARPNEPPIRPTPKIATVFTRSFPRHSR